MPATWAEVVSDMIKIGVPSLLTGATAFFIARGSRSHELEKERRRRRQDFLEKLGDALDDLEVRLSDVHIAALAANPSDPEHDLMREFKKQNERCSEAARVMSNWNSRIVMVGFSDCLAQYEAFIKSVNSVYDQLARWENFMPAQIGAALDKVFAEGEKFRKSLAEAYRGL